MRILLSIVHYWDPDGNGHHQSLRPNPAPKVAALQELLLGLCRLGSRRSYMHHADLRAYPADEALRHHIDVRIITDGQHNVLDKLAPAYRSLFEEVVTKPDSGVLLGFEAHRYLADHLDEDYDLFGYFEDDLVIQDPFFFQKVHWFTQMMGADTVLLPQRVEFAGMPSQADRFYIDGPLNNGDQLAEFEIQQGPVVIVPYLAEDVLFETPRNPHAGCFVLSKEQLRHWISQSWWLDRDCSFITPLESAATLGLLKTFRVYKPCISHAAWLELQHWGVTFHCLLEDS